MSDRPRRMARPQYFSRRDIIETVFVLVAIVLLIAAIRGPATDAFHSLPPAARDTVGTSSTGTAP